MTAAASTLVLRDAYCPNAACPALGITRRPAWLGSVHSAAVLRCTRCRRRYLVMTDESGVTVQRIEQEHKPLT